MTQSLAYKERYLNVKPEDIVLIKSTVGMPGRALRSPFVERLLRGEREKNYPLFGMSAAL